MLAAECMRRHTADAGWQLTLGLENAGYELWGFNFPNPRGIRKVPWILEQSNPDICVIQDKREWQCKTAGQTDHRYEFLNIEALKERDDIFKVTVLKDAQNDPQYHRDSAEEMGVHAWITYYHPDIIKHVAPYVRGEHLIRTYHSVDPVAVRFKYKPYRLDRALLSGAIGPAYPLRSRLARETRTFHNLERVTHPGYHAKGCVTPQFLELLSRYKVAICTSSRYGYSLRKIIEATACGCKVITDLPSDDVLPVIDDNLIRVSSDIELSLMEEIIDAACSSWDIVQQWMFSERAANYYSWQACGRRLAANIEKMRVRYDSL